MYTPIFYTYTVLKIKKHAEWHAFLGYFYKIRIDFIVRWRFRQPELDSGSHKTDLIVWDSESGSEWQQRCIGLPDNIYNLARHYNHFFGFPAL